MIGMGADQFRPDQPEMLASFFAIFYFSINTGSTLSTFFTPVIRSSVGYWAAFAVPAALLCFATFLFAIGYRGYTHVPPTGIKNNVFLQLFRVIGSAIRNKYNGGSYSHRSVLHWIDRARADYSKQMVYDVKCVLRVCKVLLPLMVFWSLFDQHSTRWVFQAVRMDRQVGSYKFTPDQITTLNPLLVIFLVILFDRVIYRVVEKCVRPTPLRRIAVGFIFTSLSFIASAIVEVCIVYNPGRVHVGWQIPQYVLLVIGEILVSVTGLEFAYSQAPKYYKGVMQSFYLFTVSMGNVVVLVVALAPVLPNSMALKGAYEFSFFALLMFLTLIIFIYITNNYKYRRVQVEEQVDNDIILQSSLEDVIKSPQVDYLKVSTQIDEDEVL
jgi:POT family proton-dependent oligopeptide transporter